MGIAQRFHYWNDAHHHPIVHTIIRAALGMLLILKGINFISNSQSLHELILQSTFSSGVSFLVSYIIVAHLLGGVLIVVGLFTRIAVLIQLPILIGAIFFINLSPNVFGSAGEIVLAILALLLCIYLLITGSGDISMDDYLKKNVL